MTSAPTWDGRMGASRHANSGGGPSLQTWDIGHRTHVAVIEADTAFWSLVRRERLGDVVSEGKLLSELRARRATLVQEMNLLRFGLQPSCVYFNATDRCNLGCGYCYIPADVRKRGQHMKAADVVAALEKLREHFEATLPAGRSAQIIFHGAEPLLNREAVFFAIERYASVFRFGLQTNATLLDEDALTFLKAHHVGIGLSLDAPDRAISDQCRPPWGGRSVHEAVVAALEMLRGYHKHSVICTITTANVDQLVGMVEYLHAQEVPACMLNPVRCTMPGARVVRPDDAQVVEPYLAALQRSHELYHQTGRKLVVANFANALLAIVAPTARRQMCDISPCGGGRSFFAVTANGDLYPCSEFIGLPAFRGGNLFRDSLADVLKSDPFREVSTRRVEQVDPCNQCAIRHFCGAPCPAEAREMNGSVATRGGYCALYEEQTRFAFRVIADGEVDDYVWDGWRDGTHSTWDDDHGRVFDNASRNTERFSAAGNMSRSGARQT